ncbi:MAG: hypothetical protein CM15mP66_09650 [Pseudomonadota bacterium]|nr:MAG: hypothetical protein CM15mP66_09650 [Pseudomonadota bacterium]
MTSELLGFTMFGVTMVALLLGFPVALTIAGSALIFAFIGDYFDLINFGMLSLYPLRIFGIMKAETLVAVPLFVFMGVMLEKSNIAVDLLEAMGKLFGKKTWGTWNFCCYRRCTIGSFYRYCRSYRGHDGVDEFTCHVKSWIQQ